MSPSATLSSTPVTVTVWAVFQLGGVNVTVGGATVPSAVLLDERATVTLAVGWLARRTVNVAVPPDSVVTSPATGATTTPATSLSWFVTETSPALYPA